MKKFVFSLDAIKNYKEKQLDNIKMEYAAILAAIDAQHKLIEGLEETERVVNSELNEKNSNGIAPHELMNYSRYLKVLQSEIKREYEKLKRMYDAEAKKKDELIEMKKETASFEKLEEKRLEEYNAAERKEHELFIEEFVGYKKYAVKR
jgi:flagellar FliJ protein